MAKLTPRQYAEALFGAIQETRDHETVLDNFVKILAQNGDLAKHPEIEAEFKRLEGKSKGLVETEITMARNINVDSALLEHLNRQVSGKPELKHKLDQGLVGGVVIRAEDMLVDASIKTQLENLNKELKE